MRVPIVDIGNSKGIRIPQAILKQLMFSQEVEMEIAEGRIVLKRSASPSGVPDFSSIPEMEDVIIQRMLRKIGGGDLLTALVGADETVKQAVYRNLSPRVRDYLEPKVKALEAGDARDILVERSRNAIAEAFMEVMQE